MSSAEELIIKVTNMYKWFNYIADPKQPFSKKDLEQFFTTDFIMQLNDQIITENHEDLWSHFNKFRDSGSIYSVVLPFEEIIVSQEAQKCVVRYKIFKYFLKKKIREIKVIAIWHKSSDGRLQRMNEVVHFSDS